MIHAVISQTRVSVYVSLANVCCLYWLCWVTLGLALAFCVSYTLLSLMTPSERLYLATRAISYARGIGCGDAGAMLSKDQLDSLYCGPGRSSCTSS